MRGPSNSRRATQVRTCREATKAEDKSFHGTNRLQKKKKVDDAAKKT